MPSSTGTSSGGRGSAPCRSSLPRAIRRSRSGRTPRGTGSCVREMLAAEAGRWAVAPLLRRLFATESARPAGARRRRGRRVEERGDGAADLPAGGALGDSLRRAGLGRESSEVGRSRTVVHGGLERLEEPLQEVFVAHTLPLCAPPRQTPPPMRMASSSCRSVRGRRLGWRRGSSARSSSPARHRRRAMADARRARPRPADHRSRAPTHEEVEPSNVPQDPCFGVVGKELVKVLGELRSVVQELGLATATRPDR